MSGKKAILATPSRAVGTKESLLEATSRLMCLRPDSDVTLSEIAAASGANSALVGYYFGNKNGLLMALLHRNMADGLAQLELLITSPISATEKLRLHISGLINLYFRFPYHYRLMTYLIGHSEPKNSSLIADDVIRPLVGLYRKLLEDGEHSGEFRRIDPMFFYFSLIGACERFFTGRYSMQKAFDVPEVDKELKQKFIDHTIALLISGMRADSVHEAERSAASAAP